MKFKPLRVRVDGWFLFHPLKLSLLPIRNPQFERIVRFIRVRFSMFLQDLYFLSNLKVR